MSGPTQKRKLLYKANGLSRWQDGYQVKLGLDQVKMSCIGFN